MLAANHRFTGIIVATGATYLTPVDNLFTQASHYEGASPRGIMVRSLFVTFFYFYGAYIGSTLPDIDQRLPINHRGWTHTIWFLAINGLLTYFIYTQGLYTQFILPLVPEFNRMVAMLYFGITIGILAHLLTDFVSIAGIDPIYPIVGFNEYPKKGYRGQTEIIRISRFPHPRLYYVGKPYHGMTDIVWQLIMIAVLIHRFFFFE